MRKLEFDRVQQTIQDNRDREIRLRQWEKEEREYKIKRKEENRKLAEEEFQERNKQREQIRIDQQKQLEAHREFLKKNTERVKPKQNGGGFGIGAFFQGVRQKVETTVQGIVKGAMTSLGVN